jgi:hypothetical protein
MLLTGGKHGGSWDTMSVFTRKDPVDFLPQSKEQFITEHYWGYTRLSEKLTSQYQVEHPPGRCIMWRNTK